jgi:hypothetical protein
LIKLTLLVIPQQITPTWKSYKKQPQITIINLMKIVLALVAAVSQAVTLNSNFKATDQDELTLEAVP